MKNTKLLVMIILLATLAIGVYGFWDICLSFLGAMIVAYLLNPFARAIGRKLKLKHGLCVAIVMLLVFALAVLVISFTVPYVINQITALVRDISSSVSNFDQLVDGVMEMLADLRIPPEVLGAITDLLSNVDTFLLSLLTSILSGLVNLSLGIFDMVIVFILVVYFMLDGAQMAEDLVAALPAAIRGHVSRIRKTAGLITRKYIKSRLIVSLGMAIVTYIGFTVMGLRYSLLFAALAFVLNFIPYFGSFIAGAIVCVYAIIVFGPAKAVAVLIFIIVVQQIEGNIVAPRVDGDAVGIHPVTVMFALLACGRVFGPVGMLISTPVAGILKIIYQEAYRFVVTPDGYDPDQVGLDDY